MTTTEKVFAKGLSVFPPHEKAPDFVKFELSINPEEFIQFIRDNVKGKYLKLTIKQSQKNDDYGRPKLYAEVNDFTPKNPVTGETAYGGEFTADDVPF